jgi:hypothetical protein
MDYETLIEIKKNDEKRLENIERKRLEDIFIYKTTVELWRDFFILWVKSGYKILVDYDEQKRVYIVPDKNIPEYDEDNQSYKEYDFVMYLFRDNKEKNIKGREDCEKADKKEDENIHEETIKLRLTYLEDYANDIDIMCYGCMLSHDTILKTLYKSRNEIDLYPQEQIQPIIIPIICYCINLPEEIVKIITSFIETKLFVKL